MAQRIQEEPVGNHSRPFSFQLPADDPKAPIPSSAPSPHPRSTSNISRPLETISASNTSRPSQPQPVPVEVPVREWACYPEQRFSYTNTPIDDNTQTFDDDEQCNILEEAQRRYGDTSASQGTSQNAPSQQQGQAIPQQQAVIPGQDFPQDKQAPARMPSAYSQPPPSQPHPAIFAPYADTMHQPPRVLTPQPDPLKPPSSPPPSISPGAIPPKHPSPDPTQDRNSTVKPQDFRAPPAPYSPYPISPPDLTTAHQPGQIPHPSMTRIPTTKTNGAALATPDNHDTTAFHNSLSACPPSDLSTCFLGLFCPCILHGRVAYRLSQRSRRADPTDLLGYEKCNGACAGFAALCMCGLCGFLAAVLRGRVRRAYGVKGGTGEDCVEGCCCFCCALVQADREVKAREEGKRRWGGPGPGVANVGGAGLEMGAYGRREGMGYYGSAHLSERPAPKND